MRLPRILLVDDEPALLGLMKKFLVRRGYEICACQLGLDAWEQFRKPDARFQLVIVDLSLPDLPGETLLQRMLDADPLLRALICSGTPDSGGFNANPRVAYLPKPFLPAMLGEAVDAALSHHRTAHPS